MHRLKYCIYVWLCYSCFIACKATQKIDRNYTLFQREMDSLAMVKKEVPIIRENDRLLIKVYSTSISQEEVKNYSNALEAYMIGNETNNGISVDPSGYITLPQLGKIKASGLNVEELENIIRQELKKYIKDLGVTIRHLTYNIIVLGEVAKPGLLNMVGTRNTIIDVIANIGLSESSRKDSILLIREENGNRKIYSYDLRKGTIFSSPVFHLKQNDIVYVLPTERRLKELATDNQLLMKRQSELQTFSILIGSISIMINLFFALRNS